MIIKSSEFDEKSSYLNHLTIKTEQFTEAPYYSNLNFRMFFRRNSNIMSSYFKFIARYTFFLIRGATRSR
jgi:hypothetical protein